eukprot:7998655-Alexandrium_andersonii.AAC.1
MSLCLCLYVRLPCHRRVWFERARCLRSCYRLVGWLVGWSVGGGWPGAAWLGLVGLGGPGLGWSGLASVGSGGV